MFLPDEQPLGSTMAHDERRKHVRHIVQVQLELKQEGSDVPMRLTTTDLSLTGCYVEIMMPFPVSTVVQAKLWVDGQPVLARGRVVTCHPQFGNGIMFTEIEGDGEQQLQKYLEPTVSDGPSTG